MLYNFTELQLILCCTTFTELQLILCCTTFTELQLITVLIGVIVSY